MLTQNYIGNKTEEPFLQTGSCIACSGKLSFLGMNAGYEYKTCNNCLTVQINPIPSARDIELAYTQSQFATHIHGQGDPSAIRLSSRPYYESIANALSDHNVSGLVIDYGAGWGGLCELLIERSIKCKGIELAQNMVDECRKQNLPVVQQSLQSLIEEGHKAQAVTLCGVFEHLANPKAFLQNVYELLEDGGILVSLQPTATFALLLASVSRMGQKSRTLPMLFWIFDAPWHIALYSIEGMKLLAQDCGFDLVEIRFSPQGRVKGFYGIAQRCLELVNKIGWDLFKNDWPLLISHTYVFRKHLKFP